MLHWHYHFVYVQKCDILISEINTNYNNNQISTHFKMPGWYHCCGQCMHSYAGHEVFNTGMAVKKNYEPGIKNVLFVPLFSACLWCANTMTATNWPTYLISVYLYMFLYKQSLYGISSFCLLLFSLLFKYMCCNTGRFGWYPGREMGVTSTMFLVV